MVAHTLQTLNMEEVKLTPKWNGNKEGYIDDDGNWIIDPVFDTALHFEGDIARVEVDGKWGLINRYGGWIARPEFNSIYSFEDGVAATCGHKKWGLIDRSGEWVVPPAFDDLGGFSFGLSTAMVDGYYGYIDKTGNMVIEPQFNMAFSFDEYGYAEVESEGEIYWTDREGCLYEKHPGKS